MSTVVACRAPWRWFVRGIGVLLGSSLALAVHAGASMGPRTGDVTGALVQTGAAASTARVAFARGLDAYAQGAWALAERLWLPIAREGDKDAAYHLALLYERREAGSLRALVWYRLAARWNHRDAQHNLALAYMHGEGVPRDLAKARYWWQRAARQGNVDSQYNLGLIYALGGEGVAPDRQRARFWWLQAARHGDAAAQYNLGTLYASEPRRPDYCQARRWFTASSRNGFLRAADALAMLPPTPPCQ